MDIILSGFSRAISFILSFDKELYSIIFLSLKVSGVALIISTLIGISIGAVVSMRRFFGRDFIISLLNTFMGLPPVVVGLFVYLLLSRSGPFGFMGLLYTPSAMAIAQTILATPIIAALSHAAIVNVEDTIRNAAMALGATPLQASVKVITEARYSITAAVIAGFGRAIAEVGAILIVGGNIAGYTRVMTTTIALETDKGNFELALALGIVLLLISLIVNTLLYWFQKRGIKQR
ncbi:MAG: ABC transporter permease [Nitrospirota bacterium]